CQNEDPGHDQAGQGNIKSTALHWSPSFALSLAGVAQRVAKRRRDTNQPATPAAKAPRGPVMKTPHRPHKLPASNIPQAASMPNQYPRAPPTGMHARITILPTGVIGASARKIANSTNRVIAGITNIFCFLWNIFL